MIAEFYEDTEIFITGGSGVVGKALIEKLLRSCNVRKIFLLLRPKKNLSIEERLQKLKNAMIFRRLHKEKPNEFEDKICVIPGDVMLPKLGLTREHAQLLENVCILFHSAATVRFDESLRDAIALNVGGTHETLKLAETLKNLKVFLYVSTFYSTPYLQNIEPKFYESPMDWKFCLDMAKRNDVSDEMLGGITRKLIVGFPNTYCFTKNLSESLVNDYRHKLPVAIYRPSIVIFAIEDPEPGYSPTLFGAMGLFALAGAGILKTLYIGKNQRLDLSPQDVAVKTMIYYTAKTAQIYAEGRPPTVPVFLVSSCSHCEISFREYIKIAETNGFWLRCAFEKNFLIPGILCTDNRVIYQIVLFVKQILPSLLADALLKLSGREPELMKLQRRVYTTLETMKPFLFNNFESPGITNAKEMLVELSGTDFDMDHLTVSKNYYTKVGYVRDMIYSIREVLMKENISTLPRSRIIMQTKIVIYRMLQMYVAFKLYKKAELNATNWFKQSEFFN